MFIASGIYYINSKSMLGCPVLKQQSSQLTIQATTDLYFPLLFNTCTTNENRRDIRGLTGSFLREERHGVVLTLKQIKENDKSDKQSDRNKDDIDENADQQIKENDKRERNDRNKDDIDEGADQQI